MKPLPLIAVILALAANGFAQTTERVAPASFLAPPTPREFRAAWVATVGNSTWPSRRGLSVDDQKKEMIDILDRAVALRLNAIILQVRTQCDALYDSKIEPWSEFLTGTEGKAPEPYYDPLATWIDEAHKRGLELHAWFNPYRAKSGKAEGERAANHVSKTMPQIVRQYGRQLWLDPGDPATIDYSLSVFMDVVKRYDVDGVHIDDYFYPYKISEPVAGETAATAPSETDEDPTTAPATRPIESTRGWRGPRKIVDFPDDATWARYQQSGGKLSRSNWRRQNVNTFIEKLYNSIKAEKRWVKFGISPFGIWRPGNPSGIRGLDAYDSLYADSRLWFSKGWCDYFSPQLYWGNEGPQAFGALFTWWNAQNSSRRFLFPGIAVGRRDPAETIKQIMLTRSRPSPGVVHWSAGSLFRNERLCDMLIAGPYAEQALVPPSIWLDNIAPQKPDVWATRNADGSGIVHLTPANGESIWLWSIKARYGTKWKFFVRPGAERDAKLDADPKTGVINSVIVTAVDRCGNESERVAAGLAVAK